eukprot:COSAG03_NODE_6035_length_1127_cov_1.765564_1_plen_54_part_10
MKAVQVKHFIGVVCRAKLCICVRHTHTKREGGGGGRGGGLNNKKILCVGEARKN